MDDPGTWHGCLALDIKDKAFISRAYYQDSTLISLVEAASIILDCPSEKLLKNLGSFAISNLFSSAYGPLLRSQGSTLRQWLSNLNAMHDHFQKSFSDATKFCPPVFWCEDCKEEEGSLLLHYFSHRGTLFVPMVVAMVERLASHHFEVNIKTTQIALQNEAGSEQTSWRISAVDKSLSWKLSTTFSNEETATEPPTRLGDSKVTTCPFTGKHLKAKTKKGEQMSFPRSKKLSASPEAQSASQRRASVTFGEKPTAKSKHLISAPKHSSERGDSEGISMKLLREVFPFHVIVDREFRIHQVGLSLPQVLQSEAEKLRGMHMREIFKITRPVTGFTWEWQSLNSLFDHHFFLSPIIPGMRDNGRDDNVNFKAAMLALAKDKVMFSLCPNVKNLQQLNDMGLTLSDLSLVTSERDAIFLGEYVAQEAVKTNSLDKISKDLKSEQVSFNIQGSSIPKEHFLRCGLYQTPIDCRRSTETFYHTFVQHVAKKSRRRPPHGKDCGTPIS